MTKKTMTLHVKIHLRDALRTLARRERLSFSMLLSQALEDDLAKREVDLVDLLDRSLWDLMWAISLQQYIAKQNLDPKVLRHLFDAVHRDVSHLVQTKSLGRLAVPTPKTKGRPASRGTDDIPRAPDFARPIPRQRGGLVDRRKTPQSQGDDR